MENLIGRVFGKLTVLSFNRLETQRSRRRYWNCVCECGKEIVTRGDSLKNGHTKSCKCDNRGQSLLKEREYKHGMCDTPEYAAWESMKSRCYYPKARMYKWYGAIGRVVCDRWLNSFENFFADMGKKPSPKHSLERKENDGNYEPSNCYWATRREQDRNTSRNRWIEYNEIKMVITDWATELNTSCPALRSYLKRHSFEEAYNHYSLKNKK